MLSYGLFIELTGICCYFYFIICNFIYFWLHWVFVALHGLFSSCSEQLFIKVHWLLIEVVSLVEHRPLVHRLQQMQHEGSSSCGSEAEEGGLSSCGLWNLPGPGIRSMSPALAGRFLSTMPQVLLLLLEFCGIVKISIS